MSQYPFLWMIKFVVFYPFWTIYVLLSFGDNLRLLSFLLFLSFIWLHLRQIVHLYSVDIVIYLYHIYLYSTWRFCLRIASETWNWCRYFQLLDLCIRLLPLRRLLDFRFILANHIFFFLFLSLQLQLLHKLILYLFFQALVQFSDSDTATSAKNALDGRSIPRWQLYCFFWHGIMFTCYGSYNYKSGEHIFWLLTPQPWILLWHNCSVRTMLHLSSVSSFLLWLLKIKILPFKIKGLLFLLCEQVPVFR